MPPSTSHQKKKNVYCRRHTKKIYLPPEDAVSGPRYCCCRGRCRRRRTQKVYSPPSVGCCCRLPSLALARALSPREHCRCRCYCRTLFCFVLCCCLC